MLVNGAREPGGSLSPSQLPKAVFECVTCERTLPDLPKGSRAKLLTQMILIQYRFERRLDIGHAVCGGRQSTDAVSQRNYCRSITSAEQALQPQNCLPHTENTLN
jgi:hypothetical protein